MSACAVVKGLQRNIFVVPTADTLAGDEDLRTLEKEIEADPSQPKGPLMKRLHVSLLTAHNTCPGEAVWRHVLHQDATAF